MGVVRALRQCELAFLVSSLESVVGGKGRGGGEGGAGAEDRELTFFILLPSSHPITTFLSYTTNRLAPSSASLPSPNLETASVARINGRPGSDSAARERAATAGMECRGGSRSRGTRI